MEQPSEVPAAAPAAPGRAALRFIAIPVVAALLLWFVLAISAAGVFRNRLPDWALAFAPFDARAQAQLATRGLDTRMDAAAIARVEGLTVAALRRDATVVGAVTSLALTYALRNRIERAERAFQYAARLSRRDIPTQLWLLEREVQRDNIVGALSHFDTILRVSPAMGNTLFPILAAASTEPPIAAALNRMLRTRPTWRADFISALLMRQGDPRALYSVTRGLLSTADERERGQLGDLLKQMTEQGAFDLAWRTYVAARPERARGGPGLWNGDFSQEIGLAPFDWGFAEDPALIPERRPRGNGTALYLPTGATTDVEVARQLIRLAPGRHVVRADVGNVSGDESMQPHLQIRCARAPGRELARFAFPEAAAQGRRLSGAFTVPADCPFQWIGLTVRGSFDRQMSEAAWIGAVRIGEP